MNITLRNPQYICRIINHLILVFPVSLISLKATLEIEKKTFNVHSKMMKTWYPDVSQTVMCSYTLLHGRFFYRITLYVKQLNSVGGIYNI